MEMFGPLCEIPLCDLPEAFSTATAPSLTSLTRGSEPVRVSVLASVDAYVSGNVSTQRYSDRGLTLPDNSHYPARLLTSRVEISQSAVDSIGLGGRIALTAGDIDLANYDAALDDIMEEGSALGRGVTIRTLPAPALYQSDAGGGNLSASSVLFTGVAGALTPVKGRVRLSVSDLSDRLNVPLQPLTFDGTGETGGPPELSGQRKPVSLGYRFNVTPVSLGSQDLGGGSYPTYMTHGGEIFRHTAVRIRGVAQSQIFSAAPGIGQYRDWPQYGCFQLGSTPDGAVTCDVQGDAPSSAYAGSAADILERMLRNFGAQFSAGEIDSDSFARVATALPGEQGWGTAQPMTAAQAIDEYLAHTGIWLSGGRDGKLRASLATQSLVSPQGTLRAYDICRLLPLRLPSGLAPAPYAVEIMAQRNWTLLTDIAGSVTGTERDLLAGPGTICRAVSSTLQTRQKPQAAWAIGGLYRYVAYAQSRADALRDWVESGLRMFEVETDKFRGQINIGDVIAIESYPRYGLGSGFTGLVAAWRENAIPGRVTMILIG